MQEENPYNSRNFHLAGVVPVAGPKLDFQFPWHDCMQPIAKNYLAIERAVVECAYAGCETIWVVCNDDMQPLIKHRMGDYIEDPYYLEKAKFVKYPSEHRRQIPIFYSPIHPKDRDRRDSLGWSALHGALTAFVMSNKISKWLSPSRYYIAFPYGVYPPDIIKRSRKRISSEKPFFLSYNNLTIKDGEYLGFTMDAKEYISYVNYVKNTCTGGDKSLKISERWSSRHFGLDKIFKNAIVDKLNTLETNWYFRIDCWENYKIYLSSNESDVLIRPNDKMFKKNNYFGVAKEEEHAYTENL